MIKLKWHGEIPDNILEIEHVVQQDLVKLHEDLDKKPSNLIFHTVFVGEDPDGPIVHVWSEDNDDEQYHCEYDAAPVWQSFTEQELKDSVDNTEK
jgi:hypothetical protein